MHKMLFSEDFFFVYICVCFGFSLVAFGSFMFSFKATVEHKKIANRDKLISFCQTHKFLYQMFPWRVPLARAGLGESGGQSAILPDSP